MGLATYQETMATAWVQAVQQVEVQRLALAEQVIDLHFSSAALVQAIMPALAHLAIPHDHLRRPEIVFYLWDGAGTSLQPPRPPFELADYRRYGQRAVAHAASYALMHSPVAGLLYAYDASTRQGYFWCRDVGTLSIYEQAAPLQSLFHWALGEFGWQVVHAAAVGTEAGGVLLIGNSGAGKSTTALSCLTQAGLQLLCDDKCLVRLEPTPQAYALFTSAKLKTDMLERLPHFRAELAGWDEHTKGGKGLVFLYPSYAEQMITSLPIKALLLPRVTQSDTAVMRPTTAALAFRQLGPSTVIWLPGAEADNYRFTAELTRRLPTYQLDLALEPVRNSAAIADLLKSLL